MKTILTALLLTLSLTLAGGCGVTAAPGTSVADTTQAKSTVRFIEIEDGYKAALIAIDELAKAQKIPASLKHPIAVAIHETSAALDAARDAVLQNKSGTDQLLAAAAAALDNLRINRAKAEANGVVSPSSSGL